MGTVVDEKEGIFTRATPLNLDKAQVSSDLDLFDCAGIPADGLSISRKGNDGLIIYEYKVENYISSLVTVEELENGALKFIFSEDGVENELVLTTDNRIFLDGREVTYTAQDPLLMAEADITPYSYSTQQSLSPLSGKKSDYNIFVKDYTVNNISLAGQVLSSIGIGTLTTIISAAASSMGVALYATVVAAGASALVSLAKSNPTYDGSWASCLVNKYAKSGNTSYSSYYMYKVNFYTKKNCTGGKSCHEYYEYRYFW